LGRILIIVSILLFVLLALVFALSNATGGGEDEQASFAMTEAALLRPAVVLLESVEQGGKITIEKLDVVQVHPDIVSEFTFADLAQVDGLFARRDMKVGEYVQLTLVTDNPLTLIDDLGSSHAALIPAGMVAFPIPITRFSSIAYGIARGDHVNVIATLAFVDVDSQFQSVLPNNSAGIFSAGQATFVAGTASDGTAATITTDEFFSNSVAQSITGGLSSPAGRAELDNALSEPFYYVPSEPQRPRLVSQTVIFNKVVLHVGDFPLLDEKGDEVGVEPESAPEEVQEGEATPVPAPEILPPDIVTLIVSPQEAVALNFLIYSGGELTLALRAKGDEAVLPTDAVTLQYLMDVYRIPSPVKLGVGISPRVDVLEPPILTNDIPEEPQQ
ncbi:MAG: hypothetical protein N2D54_11615, partial [Chloroflexota bacterium]